MAETIKERISLDGEETVTSVAAHPRRMKIRGYDHAELLARAVAKEIKLPFKKCLVEPGGLVRSAGSGRAVRLDRNTAVSCKKSPAQRVLLIDDVYTTGMTLGNNARALKDAGANWVAAATFTRTLP